MLIRDSRILGAATKGPAEVTIPIYRLASRRAVSQAQLN
jgi:hypothetical protein